MTPRRRTAFLFVVALVGLLSLAQLQAAVGACGSVFRAAGVSWDSPTSQAADELATQSVPCADPAAQIREQADQARRSDARLVLPEQDGRIGRPGLDTGATRSPPLA